MLCMILALVLAFSLCACGSSSDNSSAGGSEAAASNDVQYVFLGEDLGVESYAIGFRIGDDELAATVSGALEALVLNGTYDEIGKKYPEIYDFLCLNK